MHVARNIFYELFYPNVVYLSGMKIEPDTGVDRS